MNNTIIVNISELKKSLPQDVKVRDIKNDLESVGAEVLGTTDDNGNMIMVINNVGDFAEIEAAFDDAGVTLEDFIIDDDDFIPDYDNVDDDVFENRKSARKAVVNEKKEDCCPKKKAPVAAPIKKKRSNTVNLHEALNGTKKVDKKRSLDEVINSIVGKDVNESIAQKAMAKARKEAENKDKFQYLREKLGVKKFNVLLESLENGKQSMGNFSVNGKNVADYTTEELSAILEKVNKQIAEMEVKVGVEGLNETESAKLQKTLEMRRKLAEMLNDEIDFRNALTEADEEKSDVKDPFGSVDAVPTGESDDEKSDDAEEKTDDDNADDEKNPDEDQTVELSQIVITLSSKEAAEDMKKDLMDAGVPEDAIEIEKAEDDDDEEKSDSEDEKSDEEEKPAEDNGEEKQEESVKSNGNKLNEDDDNADADAEKSDDATDDDAEKENADEEAYKLTLIDTEYANQLADVLQNIWGMSNEEFNELIGGELVTDEDADSDSENADGDDDAKDADDSGDADTDADDEDFNPEDIFKGL